MSAVFTFATASELNKLATVSPVDFVDNNKSGIAVLHLRKWDHHRWDPDPNNPGTYKKGALVRSYADITFALERRGMEIRVVGCLPSQRDLFPVEYWEFRPEKSDANEELKKIAFSGLEVLGAMLRTIHYLLEASRRGGRRTGGGRQTSQASQRQGFSPAEAERKKVAALHTAGFMQAVKSLE